MILVLHFLKLDLESNMTLKKNYRGKIHTIWFRFKNKLSFNIIGKKLSYTSTCFSLENLHTQYFSNKPNHTILLKNSSHTLQHSYLFGKESMLNFPLTFYKKSNIATLPYSDTFTQKIVKNQIKYINTYATHSPFEETHNEFNYEQNSNTHPTKSNLFQKRAFFEQTLLYNFPTNPTIPNIYIINFTPKTYIYTTTNYYTSHKVKSLSNVCSYYNLNLNFKFSPYIGNKTSHFSPQNYLDTIHTYNNRYKLITTKTPSPYKTFTKPKHCKVFLEKLFKKPVNFHSSTNSITYSPLNNVSSRNNNKLILTYIGLFITNNLVKYRGSFLKNQFKHIFKLKKHTYSFLKPNQIKNLILRRKSAIILYNTVRGVNTITSQPNRYIKLSKLDSILSTCKNMFMGTKNSEIINTSYIPQTYKKNSTVSIHNEVKLPRVRFKPGYQRIWREARLALKDSLGLKFLYQKQLTKYVLRFYRKTSSIRDHVNYELSLDKLVIFSKIVPDAQTFNMFYTSNLFFLNGIKPTKSNITCVVNDFIQLVVSKWYYIFFRWLLNWTILRSARVNRLIYKKGLSAKYTIMKSRKQRSTTVPDWIFLSKYDFSDVKPFLEVDYMSLSFFLIYEPYLSYYYSPTKLVTPTINLFRLYNWKYIT